MELVLKVDLFWAASALAERLGEVFTGLSWGRQGEQIPRVQRIRTLDQEVVDGAFSDFSLTLNQSHLSDLFSVGEPGQEVA